MRVAVEIFAAVNLCMDTVSVLAACKLCSPSRVHPLRVLAAAALGTAYALAQALFPLRGILAAAAFAAVTYIMAAIAVPASQARERVRGCVVLLACCMLTGGACTLLLRTLGTLSAALMAGGCVLGVCVFFLCQARQRAACAAAVITCIYAGRRARMRALIDTGNRLCDPLTGLPVIAAPREALGDLVPPGVDPANPATLPPGFRLLRAQTAAGPCLLMCFHPQQLMIEYEGRCFSARALIALSAASEGALALVPSQMLLHQSAAMDGVKS